MGMAPFPLFPLRAWTSRRRFGGSAPLALPISPGEKKEFLNAGRWRDAATLARIYRGVGRRCDAVGADVFDPLKTEVGKIGRSEAENQEAVEACVQQYPDDPRCRHQAGMVYLYLKQPERVLEVPLPSDLGSQARIEMIQNFPGDVETEIEGR